MLHLDSLEDHVLCCHCCLQADSKLQNKMRDIRVAKLVLNICVGESGDRLQKAAKVGKGAHACKPRWHGSRRLHILLVHQPGIVVSLQHQKLVRMWPAQFVNVQCLLAGPRAADRAAASLWKGALHSAHLRHQEK